MPSKFLNEITISLNEYNDLNAIRDERDRLKTALREEREGREKAENIIKLFEEWRDAQTEPWHKLEEALSKLRGK